MPARSTKPQSKGAATSAFPTYVAWPYALPSGWPEVLVVFHGLFNLRFDGTRNCEVLIHNTTHTLGHKHPHHFNIDIYAVLDSTPVDGPIITIPVDDSRRHSEGYGINVVNAVPQLNGVYAYTPNGFDRTIRDTESNHNDPLDFRWMLDFDGPDLHGTKIPRKNSKGRPSFNINKGVFYTLLKTCSRFQRLKSGTDPQELGYVARFMAADIRLQSGGYVELGVGKAKMKLQPSGDTKYLVLFTNDCSISDVPCTFTIGSSDETERNDFYLCYDLFDVRHRDQYQLFCSEPCRDTNNGFLDTLGTQFSTDPAPCGPTGGGGGG
jgi:hypothetical protein